jgi:hypothetical protein
MKCPHPLTVVVANVGVATTRTHGLGTLDCATASLAASTVMADRRHVHPVGRIGRDRGDTAR